MRLSAMCMRNACILGGKVDRRSLTGRQPRYAAMYTLHHLRGWQMARISCLWHSSCYTGSRGQRYRHASSSQRKERRSKHSSPFLARPKPRQQNFGSDRGQGMRYRDRRPRVVFLAGGALSSPSGEYISAHAASPQRDPLPPLPAYPIKPYVSRLDRLLMPLVARRSTSSARIRDESWRPPRLTARGC